MTGSHQEDKSGSENGTLTFIARLGLTSIAEHRDAVIAALGCLINGI